MAGLKVEVCAEPGADLADESGKQRRSATNAQCVSTAHRHRSTEEQVTVPSPA